VEDNAGHKLVLVGKLTAPFGVRGEIKMRPFMENPKALAKLPQVCLKHGDGSTEYRKVLSVRMHLEAALVTFADTTDRNQVELLRDAEVYIRQEELPPLPPGEYYQHQLLGLRVLTDAGRDLGTIEQVHFYPANDVYETADAMIPAIENEFILAVDLVAGTMTVRDVPGLEK
jgi:16S rRNA processing protein RimM